MRSKLIPTSRNNPCPSCGDDKGRCRHHADGEIILCMAASSGRKGDIVENGYKILGFSKDGLWAELKLDNSQEWTEERRREWSDKKQAAKLASAREEAEKKERCLDAPTRNALYSEILDSLQLDIPTIEELKARGFTPEEIADCGFKPVERYHRLGFSIDSRLPGIGADRRSLIVSNDGYLCPLRDYDGNIVAMQLRLNYAADGGRYRWLSSPDQTLAVQIGDVLENPLAVFKPEKPEGIALAEGTGAKPYLTSRRLNQIVIGAAGGQFASSPKLLEEYLSRASQDVDSKDVIIYPDAGDVQNKAVINRWKEVVKLISGFGYNIKLAWWGQTSKEHDDIDELDDYSQIEYISSKEFFTIAELGIKNATAKKLQEDKDRDSRDKFAELKAIRHGLTNITEVPYKVVNVPHLEQVMGDIIEPGTINIIISDTGTGKTEGIVPYATKADAFYSWHNRISLGRGVSHKLGLGYKDDIANSKHSNKKKAAFCAPSAYQFDPKHLSKNKGILLLDECDQVFDFLFGSLCNKQGLRPLLLSTLEAHIDAAIYGDGVVIAMSADVTQKEIDLIKALAPSNTPVRLIINKYQPTRPDINFDVSPSPEGQLDLLIKNLKAGIPCFVLDDMKNGVKGCKSVAEYARQEVPELAAIEIHADSKADIKVKAFEIDPDTESLKYNLVVCSPSIVSGVSLKNLRFINGVFAFCNGILIDREIKQFLNRVRGAKDIYLWVAEEGFAPMGLPSEAFTPEDVKAYYQRNYDANSKHLLSYKPEYQVLTGEWSSPHFELFCKNQSYRMITAKYLREFTKQHLQEIGYGINEILPVPEGGTEAIKKKISNIWNGIEIKEAEEIAAAEFLSDALMDAIEFGEEIPQELKAGYLKTRMLRKFGEELITQTIFIHEKTEREFTGYAAMALKNSRGDYERQLENFYLLSQSVDESASRDYNAESRQMKYGDRFAGDIRWNARRRKLREYLGLHEFLDLTKWWQPSDFETLAEKAKKYADQIKDVLGVSVHNLNNGQIFGELMNQIGLGLSKKSVAGQRWKLRKINEEDWNYCQMYVKHKEALKADREVVNVPVEVVETGATPVVEPDLIVPFVVEKLLQIQTKADYVELLDSITEGQSLAAWALIPVQEQQRISNLFNEVVVKQMSLDDIQPVEVVPVSSLELELPPTDRTTLLHRVEILRSGIKQGIDAIKNILKPWNEIWRWETVLEWEAIAVDELLKVEDTVPGFYQLLSEAVLPMEEVMFS